MDHLTQPAEDVMPPHFETDTAPVVVLNDGHSELLSDDALAFLSTEAEWVQ